MIGVVVDIVPWWACCFATSVRMGVHGLGCCLGWATGAGGAGADHLLRHRSQIVRIGVCVSLCIGVSVVCVCVLCVFVLLLEFLLCLFSCDWYCFCCS